MKANGIGFWATPILIPSSVKMIINSISHSLTALILAISWTVKYLWGWVWGRVFFVAFVFCFFRFFFFLMIGGAWRKMPWKGLIADETLVIFASHCLGKKYRQKAAVTITKMRSEIVESIRKAASLRKRFDITGMLTGDLIAMEAH